MSKSYFSLGAQQKYQESEIRPPFIIFKYVLGAVAMVHVPVEDEDTQGIVGDALSIAGGQGSCVEEAESTSGVSLCVMPRGTDDSHTVPHLHTNTRVRQDHRN